MLFKYNIVLMKERREGRKEEGSIWPVFLTCICLITQLIWRLMCKGNGRDVHSGDKPWGVTQIINKWCAEVWEVCALGKTLVPKRLCRHPWATVEKCPSYFLDIRLPAVSEDTCAYLKTEHYPAVSFYPKAWRLSDYGSPGSGRSAR